MLKLHFSIFDPTNQKNAIHKLITALILFSIVGVSAVISELLGRDRILDIEVARKLFHFTASICAAFSVLLVETQEILLLFGAASILISLLLIKFDFLKLLKRSKTKNWGLFFLPLSFTVLVLFLFPINKEIIFLSMLLLGVADASAALFGSFFSDSYFYLTSDKKSFIGSFAFFVTSIVIFILFFAGVVNVDKIPDFFFSLADILLFAVVTTILLTVVEAMSSRGFDNFTIPIFTSIIFYVFSLGNNFLLINQFALGVFLAAVVALVSIKFKFLTANGSAATFILASFIFGLGGWKWSLPIMTFFILSSLLSKIRKRENERVETYFEKTGTRDYLQVLANGGIGGILVIYNQINPNELNYFIYLAAMAAVCADTWATEIGTLRKRPTYNVLNLKKIEQGVSGGISVIGTLGAMLGSFVIALSGILWIELYWVYYLLLIIGTGLIGSFFDSILGATFQLQSKCEVCDKITERDVHCGETTNYYRGLKWLNNDAVNFLSGIASALFLILIFYF